MTMQDMTLAPDAGARAHFQQAPAPRIRGLRDQMEAWFDRHVAADKGDIAYHAGAGQVRPVGKKWDDGTESFVSAMLGSREWGRK